MENNMDFTPFNLTPEQDAQMWAEHYQKLQYQMEYDEFLFNEQRQAMWEDYSYGR
jgi:predicted nucleotidyltransferase